MMLNWPKSLSGQLILILFSGVAAALLMSAGLHLHDRGSTLFTVGGMQTAQRFADIIQILEHISVHERKQAILALDSSSQFTRLLDTEPQEPRSTDLDDERALYVQSLLQDQLGKERIMGVTVIDTLPEEGSIKSSGEAWHLEMMRQHHSRNRGMAQKVMPHGISYMAQIRLKDGHWIEFHSHLPEEILIVPEHFFPSFLLLIAIVTGLSFMAIKLVTHPLTLLAKAADRFGRDIEHQPVPESGSTELRKAARAFNAMQARLLCFVQERMHLLAAVSHDLRTPLTRMKLRSEMLQEKNAGLGGIYLEDLSEMEEMITSALDYIRGMERMEKRQLVYIDSIFETLEMEFGEMGREIKTECDDVPAFPIMPRSFKRCLNNLVENAIKYGKRAHLKASFHSDRLRISVADEGPGIPKQEMDKVFEPFVRLDDSRNRSTGGTGLGLSIARNIARSHGGELKLRNRPEGGLEAILILPTHEVTPGKTDVATVSRTPNLSHYAASATCPSYSIGDI